MKQYNVIIITLLSCLIMMPLSAQKERIFHFGPMVGTEIGGAVPFPLSALGNGKMQAFPKLHPSLGARFALDIAPEWSLGAEVTYKEVELSANAYVENQEAKDDRTTTYFTGIASMDMDFVMLEVPIYATYHFGQGRHNVLFGTYGAWVMSSSFVNQPVKGFMGERPDFVGDGQIVTGPSETLTMDFSSLLEKWDAGVLIGYENRFFSRWALGLRFSLGFKDIFASEKPLAYKMLHMRGSVTLSYDIF